MPKLCFRNRPRRASSFQLAEGAGECDTPSWLTAYLASENNNFCKTKLRRRFAVFMLFYYSKQCLCREATLELPLTFNFAFEEPH